VLVVTRPFEGVLAEHLAAWVADQPLPSVVVDHPIQDAAEPELQRRAGQLVAGVIALLDQVTSAPNPKA
jgi:hypothetical protein